MPAPLSPANSPLKNDSYKNYGLTALFKTSTDKVEVTSTVDNIAPGLKAAVHATLPDTQSAKLLVDYAHAHAHLRTTVGLNTQPKVSVAATAGRGSVIYGAEGSFDTAKSEVTGYGLLVGWTAPDSQLVLQLTGETRACVCAGVVEGGRRAWAAGETVSGADARRRRIVPNASC